MAAPDGRNGRRFQSNAICQELGKLFSASQSYNDGPGRTPSNGGFQGHPQGIWQQYQEIWQSVRNRTNYILPETTYGRDQIWKCPAGSWPRINSSNRSLDGRHWCTPVL